jgi:hypothetical protein
MTITEQIADLERRAKASEANVARLTQERDEARALLDAQRAGRNDASPWIEVSAAQMSEREGWTVPVGRSRVLVRRDAVEAAVGIDLAFTRGSDPVAPVLLVLRSGEKIAACTDNEEKARLLAWLEKSK